MAIDDEYLVMAELFTKCRATKLDFENIFENSYYDFVKIQEKIEGNQGLKGKTFEHFDDMFKLLLMYHNELKETLPGFYKSILDFDERLDELEAFQVKKDLD